MSEDNVMSRDLYVPGIQALSVFAASTIPSLAADQPMADGDKGDGIPESDTSCALGCE